MKALQFSRKSFIAALLAGLLAWGPNLFADPAQTLPSRKTSDPVNDPALRATENLAPGATQLFNGWGITPTGEHTKISDMPLKMVVSPDKKFLLAASGGFNNTGLSVIDITTRQLKKFVPIPEVWNGLAFSHDGQSVFVAAGDLGKIYRFKYADGQVEDDGAVNPAPKETSSVFLAGMAVHPKTGKIYVCNEAFNEVWVLNEQTLAREAVIPVGEHPHSCIFGADGSHLYVSNWGGRNVSIVDTQENRRVRDIPVGIRPNDMALAPDGRLFVACSGDNTVHVIQTKALEKLAAGASPSRRLPENVREIISTSLYPQSPEGSTPDAVAVSPDGKTLFVANADNNDVMVVDISESLFDEAKDNGESVSLANGFIPVGWYPTALAVSPDSGTLFVGNGKGMASRANFPPAESRTRHPNHSPAFDYIPTIFEGSVSFIPKPDAAQMAAFTEQVRKNSAYTPESLHAAPIKSTSVIPDKPGEPCPIKYVLYIIKENRTYDQVFGDMKDASGHPIGNGDPSLAIYGEKVTPNHHQIARDYVLMDNLYCNGEVSVDGHSWCDAAIATDFNERSWIISYSKHGTLTGNSDLETPSDGYLWDLCKRNGVSFKTYGEGSRSVPSANRGRWVGARDMNKVQCWIEDLQKAEKTGDLPHVDPANNAEGSGCCMKGPLHWGIVGGGLLGMTLAWELAKRGHRVDVFEGGPEPGGLASAWQIGDIVWDRHYHVTLASDSALRGLLAELNLDGQMCWKQTRTGFYCDERLHSFSGLGDYLRFPLLNPLEKLRFGLAVRSAARIENPAGIEHLTVEEWLTGLSGRAVFAKMWRPLLRAKLGENYRSTSATFMWATIRRMFAARRSGLRMEQFGYLPGGYSRMLAAFSGALREANIGLAVNAAAREISALDEGGVEVRFEDQTNRRFDRVIVTTPAPLAAALCPQLTAVEAESLRDLQYLGIVCVSLLLRRRLSDFYITNIADESIPLTGIIEMSALVDRRQFGGRSLVYLPRYLPPEDPLFRLSDAETEARFIGALQRIHPSLERTDVLACRISRVRHVFPRPIAGPARSLPVDTSIPGIHVLNSAHIRYGTLNVNETVQLAQTQARRLHELARSELDESSGHRTGAASLHALARS